MWRSHLETQKGGCSNNNLCIITMRERIGGSWLLEEAGPEGIANQFEERVSRNCDMQYVLMEADI